MKGERTKTQYIFQAVTTWVPELSAAGNCRKTGQNTSPSYASQGARKLAFILQIPSVITEGCSQNTNPLNP